MTNIKPKKKKEPKETKGEYRNLQLMEGRDDLWQFDVKTKKGWQTLTNLGGDNEAHRKAFAQNTADAWRKKGV